MDDVYLSNRLGDYLLPIWSMKNNTLFCSLSGSPNAIPPEAMSYMTPVPFLLQETTPHEVSRALDFIKGPTWYNPKEHWLAWVPTTGISPLIEDPVGFLFSTDPIKLETETADVYYSSDEGNEPRQSYAGCRIEENWIKFVMDTARRLYNISMTIAASSDWYCRSAWSGDLGTVPGPLEEISLTMLHYKEESARDAAKSAQRNIASHLGFISWFSSVKDLKVCNLSSEDYKYVLSLRLGERPKAGVMFNISRDYHEMNLIHLALHNVAAHYAWTDKEKEDKRFLRLSPDYWNEFSVLRSAALGTEVKLEDFASYENWKEDLTRTNWLFQNLKAGKRGVLVPKFFPHWKYHIVDFHLFGTRPLRHWNTIRAYSERFRAAVTETLNGTVCTFFRQNPIAVDEPPFDRPEPVHVHDLSAFAPEAVGEEVDESETYYESTSIVLEQVKVLYAPKPGISYNSFDGRGQGPVRSTGIPVRGRTAGPSRREHAMMKREKASRTPSSYGEVVTSSPLRDRIGSIAPYDSPIASSSRPSNREEESGIVSRWAQSMAADFPRSCSLRSLSPRRRIPETSGRSARSLSPLPRSEVSNRRSRSASSSRTMETGEVTGDFYGEYREVERSEREDRELPASSSGSQAIPMAGIVPTGSSSVAAGPSPVHTWEPGFQTRDEAIEAITNWAPSITDDEPSIGPYDDLKWNVRWLSQAVLICKDPRSLLRLKTYATVFEGVTKIEDVLELGIRFGVSFELYIPVERVREFVESPLSPLAEATLAALYAPGYVDPPITWSVAGGAANFGLYQGSLYHLLALPHAVAFVPKGGVCRFVAEVFDKNIVLRYARGPSVQVTHYNRGHSVVLPRGRDGSLYVTDQVSDREVSILLGHVPGKHPSADTTLWPPPDLMESESAHYTGYLSGGAYALLEDLRSKILEEHKFEWRTRAQWKTYLVKGSKGVYKPISVPKKQDFDAGRKLFARAFPEEWNQGDIADFEFPMKFQPPVRQD
ncbi:hypothetical protein B0H13DRAFT_1868349 [Mycena leptocephala]|nr:hypothetical protein B0H13DRAFT_1868349 [Mycena leptocephala]